VAVRPGHEAAAKKGQTVSMILGYRWVASCHSVAAGSILEQIKWCWAYLQSGTLSDSHGSEVIGIRGLPGVF